MTMATITADVQLGGVIPIAMLVDQYVHGLQS
jgi:hypothetical protein